MNIIFKYFIFFILYFFINNIYSKEKLDSLISIVNNNDIYNIINQSNKNKINYKYNKNIEIILLNYLLNKYKNINNIKIIPYNIYNYIFKDNIINDENEKKTQNLENNFNKKINDIIIPITKKNNIIKYQKNKYWLYYIKRSLKTNKKKYNFYLSLIDKLDVSPKEINNFYQKNKNKILNNKKKLQISMLFLFPKITQDHKNKIFEYLKKIKSDIENHKTNFKNETILLSDDNSSLFHDSLIKIYKYGNREQNKSIENILFNLKEGEISNPFITEDGINIIKLEKFTKTGILFRNILINPQCNLEEIYKTKILAETIKNIIKKNHLSINDIINKYNNNNNYFKLVINPKNLNFNFELKNFPKEIINKIKLNEIFVYETHLHEKKFFILIQIKKVLPKKKINLISDYNQLKSIIENYKISIEIKKWMMNELKYLNIIY